MHSQKPTIVVFSRVYSTGLSVIRSLGAAGYTIDFISSVCQKGQADIAANSKYVRNHIEIVTNDPKELHNPLILKTLLSYAKQHPETVILFPTDDHTTAVTDLHRKELSKYFLIPTIMDTHNSSLIQYMDKSIQAKHAKDAGLFTPMEWKIPLNQQLQIPDDMMYPCFCKPTETITGYKDEMTVCYTKQALQQHLTKLKEHNSNRSILVQEFLKIEQEIDLSGVCIDQEVIIPGIIKKLHIAKYEKGVTLAGMILPFEELHTVQESIIKMLRSFHYTGMFDMELHVVDGKIYFNEINFRSGGPNYSYFQSGVNLPSLVVKGLLKEKITVEETKIPQYKKVFLYEKVAWEDYARGYLSKKELKNYFSRADITLLLDENDPIPGKLFQKSLFMTILKGRIRMIQRKTKQLFSSYSFTPQIRNSNSTACKPRVIVVGRNYSSNLCMTRSIGQAGYVVEVLRIFDHKPRRMNLFSHLKPDAYSKYVKAYHVCTCNKNTKLVAEALLKLSSTAEKTLLIPTDDFAADAIDAHYQLLKKHFLLPNIQDLESGICKLMCKDYQKELAQAADLPVTNSCLIQTIHGAFTIPDRVKYPCFIKPNISKNSVKTIMRKCNTKEELENTLRTFSKDHDIEILVEDYIEVANEYSLLGLSTKNSVFAPGFFRVEEGGNTNSKGVTLTGRTLSCSSKQDIVSKCIKFVKSLHYEGLFDIDLIESTNGTLYFAEINLRFGASGYATTECGINLPGMFADYMFFQKEPGACSFSRNNQLFLSEKMLLEEYATNQRSFSTVKKHMKNADIYFIKNADDPKPYRHFQRFYLLAIPSRMYFRIKPHH